MFENNINAVAYTQNYVCVCTHRHTQKHIHRESPQFPWSSVWLSIWRPVPLDWLLLCTLSWLWVSTAGFNLSLLMPNTNLEKMQKYICEDVPGLCSVCGRDLFKFLLCCSPALCSWTNSFSFLNYESMITHWQETRKIQNKVTYSSTIYYNSILSR